MTERSAPWLLHSWHFLRISCSEGLDFKVGQQLFNLTVGEFAAFNPLEDPILSMVQLVAGRRDVQAPKFQCPPCTFEFIEFRDERGFPARSESWLY